MDNIKAFNIKFNGLIKEYILSLLNQKDFKFIITANAELIILSNENKRFMEILNKNIVTIDGQVPYWFIKLKYKNKKIEKLSGSDLIYDLCEEASKKGFKVFLLGGSESANLKSRERLKMLFPELIIYGYSPPYHPYPFPEDLNKIIIDKISKFSPDILFVAFGTPKQEFWIDDNKELLEKIGVRMAIGVGGAFEMVAGIEKRAPKWVQKIGLEGLWRIFQNPKRFKRFLRLYKFFKYIFD
jgi:N-acetylglucosaminyldiphosphoundecaprenol N-acetyl-beta-D-mannosaminyltransferase